MSKKNTESDLLLRHHSLNKGTAFTKKERDKLNLLGKLPMRVETLEDQVNRAYGQFKSLETIKQKNLFLNELHGINQVMFYKLASMHLQEMVPILYTPHIAPTCSDFSNEFRRSYGAYISYPDRKNMRRIINNVIHDDIEILVVTDGERILGIGDQGVGGIKIAAGKLILYSLLGGIDPQKTLPIVLDVGTNNKRLLEDPMYLGWRHPRLTGKKYIDFVDNFVATLKKKSPNILLQWEDFGKNNAWVNLNRYRKKICSFNDDIQGTAAITLATLLAAINASKQKLSEQRIVILGAGSAAIGISQMFTEYSKHKGIDSNKARKEIWLLGRNGLLTDKSENVLDIQKPYLHKFDEVKNWRVRNLKNISLLEVVKNVKPTILLGCSTVGNAFNEKIVKEMAKHVERPIILPLSNPTQNSEAFPKDLIKWTNGKALIATGSPFDPVIYKNKKYIISQCNNALIFPGIGLGIIASKAKTVPNEFFWRAAELLYKRSPSLKNTRAPLLPSLKDIPNISKAIAKKVATIALKNKSPDINKKINKIYWVPKYK